MRQTGNGRCSVTPSVWGLWGALVLGLLGGPFESLAAAQSTGTVELPLEVYNQLVASASQPPDDPRQVPASYALGRAQVSLEIVGTAPALTAKAQVALQINVLESEWVAVPVLPPGTAVESASVGGSPVQLLALPGALAWGTNRAGVYGMNLTYQVDARQSGAGYSVALPVPQAASISLKGSLPGVGLDVAVIPAAGIRSGESGPRTTFEATVPTTRGIQITWRPPSERGHLTSRASYAGRLGGDAVSFTAELDVELFTDATTNLRLLPRSVTLSRVQVDGRAAPILVDEGYFATLVRGQGSHRVAVGFEVPVNRQGGPPRVAFEIPQVPVSRIELILPGRKEVTVAPASSVTSRVRGENTVATAQLPMVSQVTLSWTEAVPEDVRAEVRANASLYHAMFAEEGVLFVRALALYEISRGETNVIRLAVPSTVQVNRIVAPSGAVADWRLAPGSAGEPGELSVFLDRQVTGELRFDVFYDRSLPQGPDAITLPILRSVDAQRQRGMVVLLSSQDLTLSPRGEIADSGATRVGENQLPAFVRETLELPVAHTFKYGDGLPVLSAQATVPERQQGRFDAQVDTLISLGEVSLRGSATVELQIKSGRILDLVLDLPGDVNLLSLNGPSLRTHRVREEGATQFVEVEFTQEMEGRFRLQATYERILGDGDDELEVPTLGVEGAEVVQGRLAVEALTALEIQASSADQLFALDPGELPKQLVLQTSHPILLAYKYVEADPPPRLALKVTRHAALQVQEAAIDRAHYRTLFTRDGLAVTTAQFLVRNSRKQFLRVRLPRESQVWSAFVDGRPEKPALAEAEDRREGQSVLIKIIHSTQPFPVELIYATLGGEMGSFGRVRATLPRPERDTLVTQSQWDVYVPGNLRYGDPRSNMEVLTSGVSMTRAELAELQLEDEARAQLPTEPLRLQIPTSGLHYRFDKLYANQTDEDAWMAIPYSSPAGAAWGQLLILVGWTLVGGGGFLLWRRPRDQRLALGVALGGIFCLCLAIGVYRVGAFALLWPLMLAALIALGLNARRLWELVRRRGAESPS